MKLTLTCRCGCTDFEYIGIDTYECTQCSCKTTTSLIGTATLENLVEQCFDKYIGNDRLEEKIRHFVDAYTFNSGAYNYSIDLTSKKNEVFIFEVTERTPFGLGVNTYPLAVMRSDDDEDVWNIVNHIFNTVSSFNINWTVEEYNRHLKIEQEDK